MHVFLVSYRRNAPREENEEGEEGQVLSPCISFDLEIDWNRSIELPVQFFFSPQSRTGPFDI